jgi:predicted ATPase
MEADELIVERFHLLDAAARAILGYAALLGYRPDLELLTACADVSRREVRHTLERAKSLDLVVRASHKPLAYRFRHALVQDAIRNALDPESARSAHAKIAGALERMPNRSDLFESLAFHWSAAGDDVRGDAYRELATQCARRLGV